MKYTFRYTSLGALFGLAFPLIATLILLSENRLAFSWENVSSLHVSSYLLWVIDTAPLFLGLFAAIAGYQHDKLFQLNKHLEDRVEERTRSLAEAKEQAEKAARVKTQFLSTMSHEIRTPLNAVIGMSELLMTTKITEEQKDFINTINISGQALLSVINNILDYTKFETGSVDLEVIEFNLHRSVEDVLDLLSEKAYSKKLELFYKVEENVPDYIFSDPHRIQQVLINLVNNAIKFTEVGHVWVLIDCAKAHDNTCQLNFQVRDTGIGIPKDRLDRLFRSFSQVDASTTRRFGGTGLGLAISKLIIEAMGGQIKVESTEGKGTTFSFSIPVQSSKKKLSTLSTELVGKRVFILDDNTTNLKILQQQLEKSHLKVDTFQQPEVLIKNEPDLKAYDFGIIDMEMPGFDGIDVARAIRQRYSTAELPLVMLSSISEMPSKNDRELFNIHITKPIRQTNLLQNLESIFFIPIAKEEEEVTNEQISATPEILIAEDNAINQKVAERMLKQLGLDCDMVSDGKQAVEACQRKTYDIVFMDMEMPEMDGLTAASLIQQSKSEHKVDKPVIIAMTANALEEDKERCLNAGMSDFLAKPVQLQTLKAIIEQWSK